MKRRFGTRAFAAFMTAAMILSTSTELASAKINSGMDQSAVTEVSDTSSAAVASAAQAQSASSIVSEGAALNAVKVPSGLKGAGSSSDPFQISNIDDLLLMNDYINYESSSGKYFVLTADIDLSQLYFPALDSKDFSVKSDFRYVEGVYAVISATPSLSGNANVGFRFNGNGHTIYNMNIAVPVGVSAAGLFGYISASSCIENVTFANCSMRVDNNSTGAYSLLAVQNNGTISNVTVSDCTVDFRSNRLTDDGSVFLKLPGGKVYKGVSLVSADNNGTISNVTLRGNDVNRGIFVRDAVQYVGGVAGQNRKTISNVDAQGIRILSFGSRAAAGVISGDGVVAKYVGVIAGSNNSFVARKPAVIADSSVLLTHGSDLMYGDYVGGLVGVNGGTVKTSSVSGQTTLADTAPSSGAAEIIGNGHLGGLVGLNNGTISECGAYDVGFVFAGASSYDVYGGLVSENNGSISGCVTSGYVFTEGNPSSAVGGMVGYAAAGSSLRDTYSFVALSAQTTCCGAVAAANADIAYIQNGNYWISTYGCTSAVPDVESTVNQLRSALPVLNIPANTEGVSFSGATLYHNWDGSRATVSVDFGKTISVDTAAIHLSRAASSFTLSSKSGGASGNVSYYAHISLPQHIGTKRTLLARITVPVLVTDLAAKGAGESPANPIRISSYEQLRYIQSSPDAHYRLDADITVGSDWVPVDFSGTFDGNGHTLRISRSLFSAVSGNRNADLNSPNWATSSANTESGVVRNLVIEATGAVYGSVFGTVQNATLDRITYRDNGDGFAALSATRAGALADVVSGNTYLHNCYISLPVSVVSARSEGIGALVGYIDARTVVMDNCGSSSILAVDGHALSKVGGLVGFVANISRGRITNCYASGSVYTKPKSSAADAYIAIGAVSVSAKSNLEIDNCYYSIAAAAVDGCTVATEAVGSGASGFVSLAQYEDTFTVDPKGVRETQIVFSLPQGLDACRDAQASDISVEVENEKSFAVSDTTVSGGEVSIGVVAQEEIVRDADSELTIIHEPTGLQIVETVVRDAMLAQNGGYYEISSAADLAEVTNPSNWNTYKAARMKLCANISLNNGTLNSFPATSSDPFTGEFIGANAGAGSVYTISNASLTGQALFPYTSGAVFDNFGLNNITVSSSEIGVGVLVGRADYQLDTVTSFSDITISNCTVVSTSTPSDPGSNPYDPGENGYELEQMVSIDACTAQVGTLAGSLCSTLSDPSSNHADYTITGISVSNCNVTNSNANAYGVGGVIGLAFCNCFFDYDEEEETEVFNPTNTYIGTNSSSMTRSFGSGDNTVSLTGSILVYNVTVTGYGSVGGVLGMAGQLPQDADSTSEFCDMYEGAKQYAGTLAISNAVVYGSHIYAGDSSNNVGGVCGGILGSEIVGDYSFSGTLSSFSLSNSDVIQSTVIAYAEVGSQLYQAAACGGIAGYCGGTVEYCEVSDSVVRSATAGGIVGRPARKDFYYKEANELNISSCVVKGATVIGSVTGSTALSLGGIAASSVNTSLTVNGCSVGANVQVSGSALHIGGLVGYVFSEDEMMHEIGFDDDSYNSDIQEVNADYLDTHECTIQNSLCAATLSNTDSSVSDASVAGAVAYAQILETKLMIHDNAFAGSYSNSNTYGYCAGVLGNYVSTYSLGDFANSHFLSNCTVAALLNSSVPNPTDFTCKLISRLQCGTWIEGSTLSSSCTGNIISKYPQSCRIYGELSSGSLVETVNAFAAQTYTNIDAPNGYYANNTNDSNLDSISGSDPTTVSLSLLTNYASTGTATRLHYETTETNSTDWSTYWYSGDDYVLTVDSVVSVSSKPRLTVTGVANSNDALIVGALDVTNFTLPDNNSAVKIYIHIPLICKDIETQVTFRTTVLDGITYKIIPDFEHLDALHNADADLTANYLVTADIAISSIFAPIGSASTQFTGRFRCAANNDNDTYYKISGLNFNTASASAGLFGYTNGATFTNVILENASIAPTGSGTKAAALVGTANRTTFNNIIIRQASSGTASITATDYAGVLAADATDCTVTGVQISGFTVQNARFCGGLFGRAVVSTATNTIANAAVSGLTVTSSSNNLSDIAAGIAGVFSGGISGANTVSGSTITGSTVSGAVGSVAANTTIAGVTVASTTSVTSNNSNNTSIAGGIVATHTAGTLSVTSCKTEASVTSNSKSGGVVGSTTNLAGLSIDHATVGGTISGSSAVGGLVGAATGSAANNTFTNTVYYATLSGSASSKGGAFGTCTAQATAPVANFYFSSYQYSATVPAMTGDSSITVPASYYDMQSQLLYDSVLYNGSLYSGGHNLDCIDIETYTFDTSDFSFASITVQSGGSYKNFTANTSVPFVLSSVTANPSGLFTGFDISTDTFAGMDDATGYAELRYANGIVIGFGLHISVLPGNGTQLDPYRIAVPKDLRHLYDSDKTNKYFALNADLDLTEDNDASTDPGYGTADFMEIWTNADWQSLAFTGTLTGTYNNTRHTIRNLSLTDSTHTSVGFFPVFKGTLTDVTFENCTVSASAAGADAGIVVGRLEAWKDGSIIRSGSISGVTVTGTITNNVYSTSVSATGHAGGVVGVSFGPIANCTVQNTFISATHAAGGVMGGGTRASGCTVSGCEVEALQYAGGVIGCTLSITVEFPQSGNPATINGPYLTGWTRNDASHYLSEGNAVVANCTVASHSQICTAPVDLASNSNTVGNFLRTGNGSCAGGIIGYAGNGTSAVRRFISINSCTVGTDGAASASQTTVTADKQASVSVSQFNYAGGMLGYLDQQDACNINNCTTYANITARGTAVASGGNAAVDETAAGGLVGAMYVDYQYCFHTVIDNTTYTFGLNSNVINGTVMSSSYAGGLMGRFVGWTNMGNDLFVSGDAFITNNIIAPKFETEGSGTKDHYGVMMGVFLNAAEKIGNSTYRPAYNNLFTSNDLITTVIYANYYSSFVSGGIALNGTGSVIGSDTSYPLKAYDVAKDTDNSTSFKAKNENTSTSDYANEIDGQRDQGTYELPLQICFGGYDSNAQNLTQRVDMSTPGSTFAVGSRTLSITSSDITLPDDGGAFAHTYTTVTDVRESRTHHGSEFEITDDSSYQVYLVADLGFGLKIGIGITSETGLGTSTDPYKIPNAQAFVNYFFVLPDSGAGENYFNKYYKQTRNIDFDDILDELDDKGYSGYTPIGTESDPFTGGYNGQGYRITDFAYSDSTQTWTGLFGVVDDAAQVDDELYNANMTPRLQNIHIELDDYKDDVNDVIGVTGGMYTGGLVGLYSSVHPIKNCSVVYGTVTANPAGDTATDYAYAGGLVGHCGAVTLDGCFTSTDVRCGLGSSNSDYYDLAKVNGYDRFSAGGIVGFAENTTDSGAVTFNRCFSSSDIISAYLVGAFVGGLKGVSVSITDGVSTATVSSLRHMTQGSNDWVEDNKPVSLVTGYKRSSSGFVESGNPYVTATNLVVAGLNTTEYARNDTSQSRLSYASLFGLLSASTSSSNVFYDADVIGRISVPVGESGNYYVKKPNGNLYQINGSSAATASGINVPENQTTVELLQLTPSDFSANGSDASSAWLDADQDESLYPILNMYDAYSKAFAKLSSLPVFADPREANDGDTGERSYRGLTYPVAIDDAILGQAISVSASNQFAGSDSNTSYDISVYGGYTGSGSGDSRSYSPVVSKQYDLLFKKNASQFLVIRNSYLDFGTSKKLTNLTDSPNVYIVRDEKSPSVRMDTSVDGISMHRAVRIPLRGEQNTVYVSTERQLRAIMGSRNGDEASASRFYKAYYDVTDPTGTGGKNVKICADIALNPNSEFEPITGYNLNVAATDDATSCGFDGSGCVISGMVIHKSTTDNVGMFSRTGEQNGSVKIQNIILSNVDITGRDNVGALIGYAGSGTDVYDKVLVVNCKVIESPGGTCTVSGRQYVGGLIGYASGMSFNHRKTNSSPERVAGNCGSAADVSATRFCVGGLIGKMAKVKVYNCYATGDVTLQTGTSYAIAGQLSTGVTDSSVGGFVGTVVNSSEIEHAFAFGNVTATVDSVGGSSSSSFGVGGFAGSSAIAISDCFSSGDVKCSLSGYSTDSTATSVDIRHGVGGLVGLINGGEVTNAYSSSSVELTCGDVNSINSQTTIGVGGVVGYSYNDVQNVYSSGSVSVPYVNNSKTAYNDVYTGSDGCHWVGGAVGFAGGSTVTNCYFDTWTNGGGITQRAVGNKTNVTNSLCGFTTDQFCDGTLITNNYLPSAQWGYDNGDGVSNAYPYLRSFFAGDVSDYVKFPAVLSIVAVRPNDRDTSARAGNGYSMAVTMPTSVHVEGVTYNLLWTSGSTYGHTYAPERSSNDREDIELQVWVDKYQPDPVSGVTQRLYTGYYDLASKGETGAVEVVGDNVQIAAGEAKVSFSEAKALARDTFTPHVGQYVKLSAGYQGYGVRTIRRPFKMMLGTDLYPYLISSAEELQRIFFDTSNMPDGSHYYDYWYSQQQPSSTTGGGFTNVESVNNAAYGTVGDKVVHFKLMINIDMTGKSFTPIGSMNGNTYPNSISFHGYELDGNDYAIVNLNSQLIAELDSTSTVKNLIIDNAVITGSGDTALIGTNNGTVDGLMLTEHVDQQTSPNGSSITSTSGDAAGLVVVNNGTIRNCVAQGTILGGGSNKYVGGIAARNNGTIETSVSAVALTARADTVGIGGLVGWNKSSHSITDSFTLGSVGSAAGVSTTAYTGGLVGVNDGTVSYSYSRAAVTGSVDKTGSFVGSNAGTVNDSFAAGKLTIANAVSGSAFAGASSGTLTRAYADKALLESGTYMLLGDAEVTENIRDVSCFSNSPVKYVVSGGSVSVTIDNVAKPLSNQTTNAYPQLKSVYELVLNNTETYSIGGTDQSYTAMKAQLLYAYSILSSVTVDTVAANYVDCIPTGTNNTVTAFANSLTGYSVTPSTSINSASATTGTVTAQSAQLSQKTGAGNNIADDLKYTLSFTFNYAVVGDTTPNPNFTDGGYGTSSSDAYEIDSKTELENLAYFGKATDAYFKLTDDVSCKETVDNNTVNTLAYPLEKFSGNLDGQSYTISDLTINSVDSGTGLNATAQTGLFNKLADTATVQNLGLVGAKLEAKPTADMLNFGLLAGESGAATVKNVYAVGTIEITDTSSTVSSPANVGGLIGKASGTTIGYAGSDPAAYSGVVTSGELRNNHAVVGSTAGGVIGLMEGGALGAAESTAYTYGTKNVGGIVGTAADRSSTAPAISNVIYAGQAEGANGATVSPIMASYTGSGSGVVTNAKYDKQLMPDVAAANQAGATATTTWSLAGASTTDIFNASQNRNKYYPSPVTYPVSGHTAFNAGLYFALARITASVAGSEGSVNWYDTIKVASPLDSDTDDTVTLSVDSAQTSYVTGNNTNTLAPNGDGVMTTGVTATLNSAAGSTFESVVNTITRYVHVKIPKLVTVNYVITGYNDNVDLTILPSVITNGAKVASNAITNSTGTVDSATVQFQKVVVYNDANDANSNQISVDAVLPTGYDFSISVDSGTVSGKTITLGQNQSSVTITVAISAATPTWGLQNLNGTVTP